MTIQKTHSLETVGGVSLAAGGTAADGAGMRRTPESVDGLSLDLLDALTLLAQDRVRRGGLRLVGEDGLLPAITQHLMQAALEEHRCTMGQLRRRSRLACTTVREPSQTAAPAA